MKDVELLKTAEAFVDDKKQLYVFNLVKRVKDAKKQKKQMKFLGVFLPIGFVVVAIIVFIMGIISKTLNSVSTIFSSLAVIISSSSTRKSSKSQENSILKTFTRICESEGVNICLRSLDDVEVVPANIKVSDDLDGRVARAVFKDGYYVIMKGLPNVAIFRQIDEDGKIDLKLMEPTDYPILEKEIPEQEEAIRFLKLELPK